jgi:hypothetical protein
LRERIAAGFPIRSLQLWQPHPSPERIGPDAGYFGGLLNIPLSEQSGDCFFLLPPEF